MDEAVPPQDVGCSSASDQLDQPLSPSTDPLYQPLSPNRQQPHGNFMHQLPIRPASDAADVTCTSLARVALPGKTCHRPECGNTPQPDQLMEDSAHELSRAHSKAPDSNPLQPQLQGHTGIISQASGSATDCPQCGHIPRKLQCQQHISQPLESSPDYPEQAHSTPTVQRQQQGTDQSSTGCAPTASNFAGPHCHQEQDQEHLQQDHKAFWAQQCVCSDQMSPGTSHHADDQNVHASEAHLHRQGHETGAARMQPVLEGRVYQQERVQPASIPKLIALAKQMQVSTLHCLPDASPLQSACFQPPTHSTCQPSRVQTGNAGSSWLLSNPSS